VVLFQALLGVLPLPMKAMFGFRDLIVEAVIVPGLVTYKLLVLSTSF